MFKPVPLAELAGHDLIPQAIINRPTSHFASMFKIPFTREHDDLDEYEVAALRIGDRLVFALKHYAGYPPNTTTIYLPDSITQIGEITQIIGVIADELRISRDWIVWQRVDDPYL